MTEHGLESWSEGLTARERVREIATTLTEPRSVEWVREEAGIGSWQTAKDELEMLAEFGQVHAFEGDDGNTKYAPNYQLRYFTEVTELINDHARDELRDEIAEIQDRIDEWKDEYGVDSRDELEAALTDAELSAEAIRDRNQVLRKWEQLDDSRRLLKHALELYDDARSLHLDSTGSSGSSLPIGQ